MPLESLFPCLLTFLASIARAIPTHLFKFKCSSLFAFYSILTKVIAFQVPKHYKSSFQSSSVAQFAGTGVQVLLVKVSFILELP